jgi:DNA-binding LacI/PurR family transcriptional regulator
VPDVELSYVAADYVSATRSMVAELTRRGHRRILHLRAVGDAEPTRDREEGYRRGLAEAGIPVDASLVQKLADPADLSAERLRRWIEDDGVTALLVEPTEDNRLVPALTELARRTPYRFPEDCSLALLGEPPSWTPELRDWTRFLLPRGEMAREAVRLLIELLAEDTPAPRQLSVPCAFVRGDSIGPAPARPTLPAGGERP